MGKLITSWHTLFQYAHRCGQLRLELKKYEGDLFLQAKIQIELDEAIMAHDEYRDICLEADEMIGLEGIL